MLIKREEVSKKSNMNNKLVAPKMRKSHKNAKEDKQLEKKLKKVMKELHELPDN